MHLVIGMTADVSLISVKFWKALESWCSNIDIIFAIQSHFMPIDIPLKSCKYTHLTLDTKEITHTINRVAKISNARDYQRGMILPGIQHTALKSVTMIDMDIELPSYILFKEAQQKLKKYDLVCANGYELNPHNEKQVYDTFPLVLENGLWMYKHVGHKQKTLFQDILRYDMFPVKYCFGGMAMYDANIWKTRECDFRMHDSKYQLHGQSCEHLRFQSCLRIRGNLTRAAIFSKLLLYRKWDPKRIR